MTHITRVTLLMVMLVAYPFASVAVDTLTGAVGGFVVGLSGTLIGIYVERARWTRMTGNRTATLPELVADAIFMGVDLDDVGHQDCEAMATTALQAVRPRGGGS